MLSALFNAFHVLATQPAPHGLPWWQVYVWGPAKYLTGLEPV